MSRVCPGECDREEYDQKTVGEMEQGWVEPSDVDTVDLYDRAVHGVLPCDGFCAGASYSRAGSCCVCDEQCLRRAGRRPLGVTLQSGRDDAVAGVSVHGRGIDIRRVNKLHQSDGGDSAG